MPRKSTASSAPRVSAAERKIQREEAAAKEVQKESEFYQRQRALEEVRSKALAAAVEALSPDDPEVKWRFDILIQTVPSHGAVTPAQCMVKQITPQKGFCVSCGDPTHEKNIPWRCPPCIRAMKLVYQTHQEAAIRADRTVVVDDDFELEDE